ncbi:hypothetical protein [Streptosporangium sp. NPDC000396]|uniref:hypothetical protein n=1 Tax=Streptosporangium sp. NPDC000396 TaxID=3366185 RepID=UPI0036783ED7
MSEPAVASGLSLLDVPPLPDTTLLDKHIGELDRAAAHHRLLAHAGGQAYRLAGSNQGLATDTLHAHMTSRDGAVPQATDLAGRLTTAADSLRVSTAIIKWAGGLLAAVAVAAGAVVTFAPHLLPRLKEIATRFSAMLRNALSHVGRILTSLLRTSRVRRADTGRVAGLRRGPGRTPQAGSEPDYLAVAADRHTPVDDVLAEELRRPGNRWRTEEGRVYHGTPASLDRLFEQGVRPYHPGDRVYTSLDEEIADEYSRGRYTLYIRVRGGFARGDAQETVTFPGGIHRRFIEGAYDHKADKFIPGPHFDPS